MSSDSEMTLHIGALAVLGFMFVLIWGPLALIASIALLGVVFVAMFVLSRVGAAL
jgi:hypothetical protein